MGQQGPDGSLFYIWRSLPEGGVGGLLSVAKGKGLLVFYPLLIEHCTLKPSPSSRGTNMAPPSIIPSWTSSASPTQHHHLCCLDSKPSACPPQPPSPSTPGYPTTLFHMDKLRQGMACESCAQQEHKAGPGLCSRAMFSTLTQSPSHAGRAELRMRASPEPWDGAVPMARGHLHHFPFQPHRWSFWLTKKWFWTYRGCFSSPWTKAWRSHLCPRLP